LKTTLIEVNIKIVNTFVSAQNVGCDARRVVEVGVEVLGQME